MSVLEDLYKQVILDHYKRPHNLGRLEQPTRRQEGVNPSCGDQLTLDLLIEDDVVREVRFEGNGCAISQASASLMTDLVRGRPRKEALALARAFAAMLKSGQPDARLGDAAALVGVAKLPARIKCASLAWNTLEAALRE
ncbi:nitrogen fixation NifU-like protein [Deinobacterium chartae]|uniref:Nitrogen fixation NifU-like protein n=1 Tax=Deinobacterium chartae TaxID=521158 RepID=A0A841I821_9DEIO|nr:SUF system NifU family Fe-S cluster assembly protein [Deinobacterium chartae]MBB6099982.1 nitrogen fixation NifU-like protein [Deinobacterium chartae]